MICRPMEAQHQQESTTNVRAGACRLEILDDTIQRIVNAVQIFDKKILRILRFGMIVVSLVAIPAQHVVDILMAGTSQPVGVCRKNFIQELTECSTPT